MDWIDVRYHLRSDDDGSEGHGDGQFALVADHGDELDELFEAVGQHRFGQCVELGALLKDLGQDLDEGRPRLQILVVAQADRVHQPRIDVGTQQIRHCLIISNDSISEIELTKSMKENKPE